MSTDNNEYQEKLVAELVMKAIRSSRKAKRGKQFLLFISPHTASITELIDGRLVPRGQEKFTNGRCS